MNRRKFLQQSGRALAAAPIYSLASGLLPATAAGSAVQAIPPAVLSASASRPSASGSASVRPAQRGAGAGRRRSDAPDGAEVHRRLARDPQRRSVERAVRRHLARLLPEVKDAAAEVGSRIIDIQLDCAGESFSDPDAAKRAASITCDQAVDGPRQGRRGADGCAPTPAPRKPRHAVRARHNCRLVQAARRHTARPSASRF